MKTRLFLAGLFLALLGSPIQSMAEDIDLYSRIPSPKNNPNILIIIDNAANFDAAATSCNYDAVNLPGSGTGGTPLMNNTAAGNIQCALYNVINAVPTSSTGTALVNIGIMVYNKNGLNASCPGGLGGCLLKPLTPMTAANKTALMATVKAWTTVALKSNNEATSNAMQESWAYYAGQTGLSGRNYSGLQPPASCVSNYVVFIGNAINNAGSPGDPANPSVSTALTNAYAVAQAAYTAAGGAGAGLPAPPAYPGPINIPSGTYGLPPANNSCGAFSPSGNWHTDTSGMFADEWARFMHTSMLFYNPIGNNTITTYTISLLGASCKPSYPALLTSMATHGGGKYFATTNATDIYQSLLRVLNEVQAVNSVFSASSLPVSVNTQGTYLNQIYIGMFRPDQGGLPRWYGNLKQYQFIYNPTTKILALGDAAGFPAISAAGTGFLDPSIASFWTCANAAQLTSAAALLGAAYGTLPTCNTDPAGGFWVNNVNGIGGAYDLPDGDVVEKGGHAQILRLTNLTDNYSTAPGSATNPRKLYTYCPSGVGCIGTLSDVSNVFDTSNAAITNGMLGTGTATITKITSAATFPTTSIVAGTAIAITASVASNNAGGGLPWSMFFIPANTNVVTETASVADVALIGTVGSYGIVSFPASGVTCIVAVLSSTTFGYVNTLNSGWCGSPNFWSLPSTFPTIAPQAAVANSVQATVTTPVAHNLAIGTPITISGCTTLTALNGLIEWVASAPSPTTFTFLSWASASGISDTTCKYTPNIATVTTSIAHGLNTGAFVTISGATPIGYNTPWAVPVTVTGTTTYTYQDWWTPAPLATFTGAAVSTNTVNSRDNLLKWVRGMDNNMDEAGPGGLVTVRPSIHGDVLHSRPVVLNYGGTIVNITSTSDSGTVRTATASTADIVTLSTLGSVVPVTFSTGQICAVTIATSTTFTYSNANCGVAGAQTVSAGANDITIFYGGNDGVFRAIDGNPPTYTFTDPNTLAQTTISDPTAGKELWGFIPPEFLGNLKRLRDNSPVLQLPSTPNGIIPTPQRKDYFADGASGIYQAIDGNGKTIKAVLYITMRRGGRFMYALDVTNHNNPIVLWKHSNLDAGFGELGQTWGLPKVAKVKGWANPVLIFGAGYSPTEDNEAPTADTMGRGIFIVDAFSGALVWSACSVGCTLSVPGMTYSIPADLTLIDRNNDGNIDRLYATDVGGNVWRVDFEPLAGSTPPTWQVNKLAALGCNTGVCAAGITPRKFLYPVEVITTPKIDYVFVASGDREHPLYTDPLSTAATPKPYLISPPYAVSAYAVTNRAYLLKDLKPGMDGSGQVVITEASLFNCATCTALAPYPGTLSGYYITMMNGEKSVNAPLVVAGFIYFGTNQAQAPNPNKCEEGLGEATGYRLSPFTGALGAGEFENGGLPPSPVAGIVNITDPTTGKTYQVPFCLGCGGAEDNNNNNNQGANCGGQSALAGCRPPINVKSSRSRPYWYRSNK